MPDAEGQSPVFSAWVLLLCVVMPPARRLHDYLFALPPGKMALWCYLIWYFVTVAHHFDPSPRLWFNSLGISAVIGIALVLSVGNGATSKPDPWQTFRLFLMPFCVSSFSSLIKGQGFVLVLSPRRDELITSIALCLGFVLLVVAIKRWPGRIRVKQGRSEGVTY